jgi:hypothetical protein
MAMSLQDIFKDNNIPDAVLQKLTAVPFNITTVKQFANFFETRAEVKTNFCDGAGVKEGNVIADLKQAWREAEAHVQKILTKTSAGLPEEIIDSPLRTEVQATLQTQWKTWYMWELPSSWRGPDSLLGRFHREFLKRTHVLYQIKKIRSLEMATTLGPSLTRHHLSGTLDIMVNSHDTSPELSINSTWGYLIGLKVILFTMALAGAFKLKDNVFAPLNSLVKHLAAAENFALTHNTGAKPLSDGTILTQLRRTDEAIRGEWAKRLRSSEDNTLGQVMEETEAYAASLWMINPTRDIPVPRGRSYSRGGGRGGGGRRQRSRSNSATRKKKPRVNDADRSQDRDGQRDGGKGGGKSGSFGSTIKTCRFNKDRKQLCKPFNDARGCNNRNCPNAHRCDVQKPSGEACNSDHRRVNHRGPTVPI